MKLVSEMFHSKFKTNRVPRPEETDEAPFDRAELLSMWSPLDPLAEPADLEQDHCPNWTAELISAEFDSIEKLHGVSHH